MRKTFGAVVAAITCALLVLPISSHAGGGPRNHKALFMRLEAGGVYASSGVDNIDISGIGGDFSFLLGGCLWENFALHGSLFSWSLWDPDVGGDNGSSQLDGAYTMSGYGVGITYYFMPSNIYLTGDLGLGRISISSDLGNDETSDWGVAMDGSIGKEWWVGNSWGLGVAAVFGFHSMDSDFGGTWSGWDTGVRFSATFN